MHHYNIQALLSLAIWNVDTAVVLCCNKLVFNPDTGAFAFTNLSFIVKDCSLVACNGGPVDKTQAALLNNSSGRFSITDKFNNEEANLVFELWEIEIHFELLVLKGFDWSRSVYFTLETIQID